jgi:hypothetical protein
MHSNRDDGNLRQLDLRLVGKEKHLELLRFS